MTEARILDGRSLARRLRRQIKTEVAAVVAAAGRPPGLAVILAGDDPASHIYVKKKEEACAEVGMRSFVRRLPAHVSREQLLATVAELNENPEVDGILVQLPLPDRKMEAEVLEAIRPEKDVDGFHPVNAGRLLAGLPGFIACTPAGIIELLRDAGVPLAGRCAVVVGRSNIVGKPVALLLLRENATVTVAHSRTRELAEVCRTADILVVAVGRPQLIRGDYIKPGAAVVDVGMNRTEQGLLGDVEFAEASRVAGWITPVPGGVGPMTIAMLLRNTLLAARWHLGLDAELGSPFVADLSAGEK
ncbi:MAG: bifunctional methylenetetrahydrofolate dehydrogenase/methenyltetrahydrofolate cyclohydrolase FolD [Limnochordales bacterium]|nr:bifunctional methylenetetrahydrofolate dehydrogenase/methenyltetrahydrofolate cyclohydrolase FolD [Limnochordales bacterium]